MGSGKGLNADGGTICGDGNRERVDWRGGRGRVKGKEMTRGVTGDKEVP